MRRKRRRRRKAPAQKRCGRRRFDHQLIELKKSLDELSVLLKRPDRTAKNK